jgi:hypothetical protein|tara:strand:- start:198 stop:386 length:189 start_codon:yes stop_codon:yes gene_type:complete
MVLVVTVVQGVVHLLLMVIIRGMVFLDKVMTAVQQPMTGNRVAEEELEKQETRTVKVTAVTV